MPLDGELLDVKDNDRAQPVDNEGVNTPANRVHPIVTFVDRSDVAKIASEAVPRQNDSAEKESADIYTTIWDDQASKDIALNDLPAPKCIVAGSFLPVKAREVDQTQETLDGFREAHLSPDGTCLLAHTWDSLLHTYVLPSDLLDPSVEAELKPYATTKCAPSIRSFAVSPHFTLAEPSTCLVATSVSDLPIQLSNALDPSLGVVATYRHINPMTEAYITPQSILFNPSGTHLLSGSNNGIIALHDLTRNGSSPTLIWTNGNRPLEPHRSGIKGIVSALDISCTGVLAAGTFMNDVGLYSGQGFGERVATFSIYQDPSGSGMPYHSNRTWCGSGITQLRWSPCANYLLIAGRMSDVILLYDLRRGELLSWLVGRKAMVHQRLSFDVVTAGEGWEVWGGGMDGCVRVWRNLHEREGPVEPVAEWRAHGVPVTRTLVHDCGRVVATLAMEDRNGKVGRMDGDEKEGSESESEEDEDDSSSSEEDDESMSEDESASSESSSGSSSSGSSAALSTRMSGRRGRMLKIWSI